ncbi:DNA polymerase IV [Parasphaerochaeta coccoides]|uniref:DNA polymerase IV n=1 Tax=Parasphaerochaeta coccoides (strain ATCC BAA-1237 / DSM 17374 / SPN1) TaxID=760011 RepID=F4GIK2_PARC1|nr:DNA polymerase IV [Parasphaerochaeta coccoides]AEC02136.1 DNA polymerase IV [Parasphaerochaeta coccoides DSM 17374]
MNTKAGMAEGNHTTVHEPVFFHMDIDAFFASVEQLDNPSLRGKPIIVGGTGPRSVASTCSYEARVYGVHSAMPMAQALRLCPHAIVRPSNMKRYTEVSRIVMGICRNYSPDVQQISVDEAFLDMTGTRKLMGIPREAAARLKKEIHDITGLTVSVGIGPSRFIAKMASDYDKPDGLCRVSPGKEILFIDAVGLGKLWGVGTKTRESLIRHHITDTVTLRACELSHLVKLFGAAQGEFLYNICRGIDSGIFSHDSKSHSISSEMTFAADVTDTDILHHYLLQMSHEVMFRALDEHVMARTVSIKLRSPDFVTVSAQKTPDEPLYSAEQVFALACELLAKKHRSFSPVRLIGVGLGQVYPGDVPQQEELFDSGYKKKRKLEQAVLGINRKKGGSVIKASLLETPDG